MHRTAVPALELIDCRAPFGSIAHQQLLKIADREFKVIGDPQSIVSIQSGQLSWVCIAMKLAGIVTTSDPLLLLPRQVAGCTQCHLIYDFLGNICL